MVALNLVPAPMYLAITVNGGVQGRLGGPDEALGTEPAFPPVQVFAACTGHHLVS